MFKKLIKFSIISSTFSTTLIPNFSVVMSVNEIYYSDAVKKVNDVRAKIDNAIEILTKVSYGIDKYRDVLSNNIDETNYEFYYGVKPYIMQNSECHSNYNSSWLYSNSCARACIYQLFGEEIVLNPYYITNVSASCRYVITSWAGNSWKTMEKWFEDSSVTKYPVSKYFGDRMFYISELNEDKKKVDLSGHIWIDKPNASIYMTVELKSSEKSSLLLKEREYMSGHTGWAIFDSYLLRGTIRYAITQQSKGKLQNLKQRIANLKSEIKNEMDKLNAYDPHLDHGNDNYETSNLKRILDNCEQVSNKANDFINLKSSNGWIQKF